MESIVSLCRNHFNFSLCYDIKINYFLDIFMNIFFQWGFIGHRMGRFYLTCGLLFSKVLQGQDLPRFPFQVIELETSHFDNNGPRLDLSCNAAITNLKFEFLPACSACSACVPNWNWFSESGTTSFPLLLLFHFCFFFSSVLFSYHININVTSGASSSACFR